VQTLTFAYFWSRLSQEKWAWYKTQRQIVSDMIGIQKKNEALADESLKELKDTLLEFQVIQEQFRPRYVISEQHDC
jgi:hypothetical protein